VRETSEASRAALVTGGTAGIGLRAAQVLREQGYLAAIAARCADRVADAGALAAAADDLGRRMGKLDVLAARGSVINFSSGLVSFLVSPQAQWITGARVSPR